MWQCSLVFHLVQAQNEHVGLTFLSICICLYLHYYVRGLGTNDVHM
jgi:hypothetical protein